jgi:hypothetical protein
MAKSLSEQLKLARTSLFFIIIVPMIWILCSRTSEDLARNSPILLLTVFPIVAYFYLKKKFTLPR